MYENTKFLQNNFYTYEDYAICGSRGWILEGSDRFTEKDKKIFDREIIRLKLSLDKAKEAGYENIVVMIHYPPMNEKRENSAFTNLFKEYGVKKVIYGHLHGPSLANVLNGEHEGIEYLMTSCDFLDFDPKRIL